MVRPPNNSSNNNNNNGAETNPVPNSQNVTGQPNQPVSGNPSANPTGGPTSPALNSITSESIPINNVNGGSSNPVISFGAIGVSASGSTMPATTSSMAGGFPPPNPNGAAMTQLNMSSMPTNVSHTHGYTDGSQVGGTPPRPPWLPKNPQFGMPTTTMTNLYNWPSIESSPSSSAMGNRGNSLNLTNNSMAVLRQQMDESNHDMVNALTQQIGTVFNPMLQTANDNYLLLANQMGMMADLFGAPDAPNNQRVPRANPEIQPEVQAQPLRIEREQPEQGVVLVNRNQNADNVLRDVRQDNIVGHNNLANLVENILAQNGLNTQVPEHELVEMAAGGLDYSIRKKAEKVRNSKFHKKEKVVYIETYESENEFDDGQDYMENNEVNIAELKPGPPYTCKMLKPSNGNNPVEPKNDRFVSKTYTFDITKCGEIFDLLVADGQIIVPKGLKVPPLEQRKKRGFCKYHNFLGHKTSQCVLFRDLVQKALQEGRLKFGEKPKSKQLVDEDPLQIADAAYTEPFECLMLEALNLTEGGQLVSIPEEEYENKVEEVYPQPGETLLDFLQRCKENDGEATLCPHCSAMFDKKAAAGLNNFLPHSQGRSNWPNQKPTYSNVLNSQQAPVHQRLGSQKSFVPSSRTPVNQWVHGRNMGFGQRNVEKGNSSSFNPKKDPESRKYDYRNNYKGKNPMTRSQWRRYQRQKKVAAQKSQITADNVEDEHMEADDFLDSEPDLDIIVNVVSILPREFDVCSEITDEEEESGMQMALHRPVCYYVMSNGALEDQMATFERPDEGMKSHLKPLFIQAKVNNVGINKVLIDGGAAVNLMPKFLLKKIGKSLVDLHPHNIVLSNYEGETGFSLGAIQLDVVVGMENVEADQSYFKTEVHHLTKHSFDKKLATISPCTERDFAHRSPRNVHHSIKLDPTHGFLWKEEDGNSEDGEYEGHNYPTGWDVKENYYV
ncbi:hypothetical protein QL285_071934 [Trifolium repens]|nr:hypothetical protein QL285_071934 [Trifolium repens]